MKRTFRRSSVIVYECDGAARASSLGLTSATHREDPRAVVDDVLSRIGFSPGDLSFPDLVLEAADELVLPSETGPWPAATVRLMERDLRRYKDLVGRPDPTGPLVPPPEDLGSDPLATLALHYLFVDSRAVARHRDEIQQRYREAPLTLITAGRIEIGRGARLILTDGPLLFLARSLVIHEGGELTLQTMARAAIDEVVKRGDHVVIH